MLNMFVVKRWAGSFICGFLPLLAYVISNIYFSFLWCVLIALVCIILGAIANFMFIKNPFSEMVEGKGLLVFDINSTGIIRPFIVGIEQPYIVGKTGNQTVNDVYDRDAVVSLTEPVKIGRMQRVINLVKKPKKQVRMPIELERKIDKKTHKHTGGNKYIDIRLTEDEFNKARFGMYQIPVLIYNSQVQSCITKDFLSEQEKKSFAEHGILYLNRKMEELTSIIRDFGRYVVELTKPKSEWFKSKWLWIIIVIFCVIMALLFAKPIMNVVAKTSSTMGQSMNLGSNPVVPR